MKPGRASRTAVMVCAGRAVAHGRTSEARFADPVAFALLPDDARRRVERLRSGVPPEGIRERVQRAFMERQSLAMVARTVTIDESIREAASSQLVILGAGLDGRAWRMTELSETTVFEVDHPDTQRAKRSAVGALTATAREVHFVPVDFERDSLEAALAKAGHDPSRPTTWVWEGVVMYLGLGDIEATLSVVARRSAPGSRLVVLYHSPAPMLKVVGLVVKRLGEPLRSSFSADAMRALLERHGFRVMQDEGLPSIGARMGSAIARATRPIHHLRVVTADRT